LTVVAMHRYLGVLWPGDFDFVHFLKQRLHFASVELAQLAGFSAAGPLPWLIVCELFETKINSILDFGRWLFILIPDARSLLGEFYDRSARLLLGADFWRNAGTCASELGWQLSGFQRVVKCVAMRRAKLWCMADTNWHATFFRMAAGTPGSWASVSADALAAHAIMDWPSWVGPGRTTDDYSCYVVQTLSQSFKYTWDSVVAKHRAHIPYYLSESHPGAGIRRWRGVDLTTKAQLSLRSWCRMRCGLLVLSHIGGKESDARHQYCIFCHECTRNASVHCLSLCQKWAARRSAAEPVLHLIAADGAQAFALACLRSDMSQQALETLAPWAAELDAASFDFWRGRA